MARGHRRPMRRRVYEILAVAREGDRTSRAFDLALLVLIVANLAAVVLESVASIEAAYATFFNAFETVSVAVFSIEYLLRLWVCVEEPRYRRGFVGRLRYAATPLALIDLLAILPFYLAFVSADLRMLRVLRVFRLLRVVKVARYSSALRIFGRVLLRTRMELLFTVLLMAVLLLLSASLMYYVENDAQPEAFSSIPAAMWWSIATLTTVGYGDVYPVTGLGRLLASVIAVFGIGMFALPTGVLGAAFLEEIRNQARGGVCPHCGEALDPPDEAGGGL